MIQIYFASFRCNNTADSEIILFLISVQSRQILVKVLNKTLLDDGIDSGRSQTGRSRNFESLAEKDKEAFYEKNRKCMY